MDVQDKTRAPQARFWRCWNLSLLVLCLALIVALVVVVVVKKEDCILNKNQRAMRSSFPCPQEGGGLMTSGDPDNPSPFHDLTLAEYSRLYDFLSKQPQLNLPPPERTMINTSSLFIVDLLMPPKQDVLSFLDNQGTQPAREARVMLLRGDKTPPVVEE